MPAISQIRPPRTEAVILNLNEESATCRQTQSRPVTYLYELKRGLNAYLRNWAKGTEMRTMADIIAFNAAHAERALRFGQDVFLASDALDGDLNAIEYITARRLDIRVPQRCLLPWGRIASRHIGETDCMAGVIGLEL
jgi:amidase